jgi:two-component system, OmpR family, manganese sensing response regulator
MEPLKILIAEDDEDIGRQYQIALDELGHDVFLTKDGQECIKNYDYAMSFNSENRITPYDVVIVDYLMPIKDGLTLTKEILKKCPQQRILFVTGHGPKLLEELNNFDGQVEVLTKPIALSSLIARIENKRHKDIAQKMFSKLKKWEKSDGLSNPTGPVRITDNYKVISD